MEEDKVVVDQNTNYNPPVEKKTLPASATPKALQAGIPTFIGIVIIVVVAVLLFVGVFTWQYFLMSQEQPIVQTPQVQDQTAGWKTYANSLFEIKYPDGYTVSEPDGKYTEIIFHKDKRTFDILMTENCGSASSADTSVANINGVNFIKYYESRNYSSKISTSAYKYCAMKGSWAYNLSLMIESSNSFEADSDPVLNQILSTFKFTTPDQVVKPSITVVSPNGGETLKVGQNVNITWALKGLLDTDNIVIRISDLSVGASDEDSKTIAFVKGNLASYNWEIPVDYKLGSKYKVSLSVVRNEPITADGSDNYFTITK